jgi:hypothetical protein
VRSLEGLWLKRPVRLDNIRVSPQVIDFFSGRSRAAEETGGDEPTLPPSEDWEDQFGPTSDAPPPGFVDSGGNGYVPAGPRAGGGSAWAREGAVPIKRRVVKEPPAAVVRDAPAEVQEKSTRASRAASIKYDDLPF